MTSCTGSARGGFWEIWKSQQLRTRLRTRRVNFRGSQRPDEFVRYGRRTRWGGADEKVILERLCISLPYAETFNLKVIKGFVPELRSRKCFSCFGIPMFYVNMLWTFYVRFTYPYLAMVQHYGLLASLPNVIVCYATPFVKLWLVTALTVVLCDFYFADYHIRFRRVYLSISSGPIFFLKDPQMGNDTIHPELLLTFRVVHWSKTRKTLR